MITYDALWATLHKKNITTYYLIMHCGVSKGTIDNLKHNRSITMETLNDLCNYIGCKPTDIINYTRDKDK